MNDSAVSGEKDFEVRLGKRLRALRLKRRMTLMYVAKQVGLSYQQIQKYERAMSRISALVLFKLSQLYSTSVESLLNGIGPFDSVDTSFFPIKRKGAFNILIVEDDPGDEAITRRALREVDDLNIMCVHDSDTAIDILRHRTTLPRPDLIFMDVFLPKSNGLSLLKRLKRDREYGDIPVVMLSNNMSSDVMMTSYNNGASGYICKSFDFPAFRDKMVNCVNYWAKSVVNPVML